MTKPTLPRFGWSGIRGIISELSSKRGRVSMCRTAHDLGLRTSRYSHEHDIQTMWRIGRACL